MQSQKNNHILESHNNTRLHHLRQLLIQNDCDGAIITKKESIYYYAGVAPLHPTEREVFLLITPKQAIIYHSPFIYPPTNPQFIHVSMSPLHTAASILTQTFPSPMTIGIEKKDCTVAEYDLFTQALPHVNVISIDTLVADQQSHKDDFEQQLMIKSGEIAKKTINWIKRWLAKSEAVGVTEQQVADMIDTKIKQLGGEGPAFPTIVAFDAHTAEPHHRPSNKTKLKTNSIILIDMGADFHLYKSDLTRTWSRENPNPPKFSKVKKIVDTAYKQALFAAQTPQLIALNLDNAARTHISQSGFADKFIHTTGHSIGLSAHEIPHISSTDSTPLTKGTAFTIEPGIYLARKFGYRHENTFIMTDKGPIATTA